MCLKRCNNSFGLNDGPFISAVFSKTSFKTLILIQALKTALTHKNQLKT